MILFNRMLRIFPLDAFVALCGQMRKQWRVNVHSKCCISLGAACLLSCPLWAQQFLDARIVELDTQGKYAEVLELCQKNIDTPVALYFIGDYYYHGRKGIKRDEQKGKDYYLKASGRLLPRAKGGDALAQYRVARCQEFGQEDMYAAAAWYAYAAEGGNVKAMTCVALLEMEVTKPFYYGYRAVHFNVASLEAGKGKPQYRTGMDLFKRAVELGDPDAKAWLADPGQEQGLALINEAAKAGSPVALMKLGRNCADVAKAIKLLQAAVDRGFSEAIEPLEQARSSLPPPPPWRPKGAAPGFGFPGKLVPYEADAKLTTGLEKFRMVAGWFVRDPIPPEVVPPEKCPDRLPWLLHSPAKSRKPVPMVIYFGGTGEEGTDLSAHFKQSVAISKVTSPAFQEHHPCYLFAPMLPKGNSYDIIPYKGNPPHLTALINDAMYALIRSLDNPPVDTNRLYVTGLSRGGSASYGMLSSYPGRFAAAIPTSTSLPPSLIPTNHPGNYWLFVNEGDLKKKGVKEMLDSTGETVRSRGGDFRLSTYPENVHDAWSKAWKEDDAWDWMFSKDLRLPSATTAQSLRLPACSASIPGKDAKSGPEHGADGLDGTSYVSATPAAKGDWWLAEYPEPVAGRVTVETGTRDGKNKLSGGQVEVSVEGEHWFWAGDFERGICRFTLRAPIRFLKVLPDPDTPETLVVRKVTVIP